MILFRFLTGVFSTIACLLKPRSSMNGSHRFLTLGDIYVKYRKLHMPTLTELSRVKLEERNKKFLKPLADERMANLTPNRIAGLIATAKSNYKPGHFAKRYSFEREVRDLKTMLLWHKNHFDFKFEIPIRDFHLSLAKMEEIPERERKISSEEILRFLSVLEGMAKDFFTCQLFISGRVGEIAGIQLKNIDLEKRILTIREVITWVKGKPTVKNLPKNGHTKEVYINDTLMEIFKRRIPLVPEGCPFLFYNENGKHGWMLRYNKLNGLANRAWKKAGLGSRFSGTHQTRYAGAQIARRTSGSLEAAAAITGHISESMAKKYALTDSNELNKKTIIQMEDHLRSLSA